MTHPQRADFVIIGGGIQGCSAAYFLASRGQSVLLLEKDHIARHASGVNAGGVRRLGRDLAEIPLSLVAMEHWHQLESLIGADAASAFHQSFYVKAALDEDAAEAGRQRVAALQDAGFSHEIWLDGDQLSRRLPPLGTAIHGGILVEGDGHAIPWRITRGFAAAAVAAGAVVQEQVALRQISRHGEVWQLDTSAGLVEAGVVINCAGAWGGALAGQLGEDIPLVAHAPMLAVTDAMPQFLPAVLGLINETLSLKQLATGQLVIGGGHRAEARPQENHAGLDMLALSPCIALARRLFPQLAALSVLRCWSGIEGYLPDHLPVIGRGSVSGIIHGFGFSAHGFQLGPAVGEVLADLAMQHQPRVQLEAFSPGRFARCQKTKA